jgi:hypothetical protein
VGRVASGSKIVEDVQSVSAVPVAASTATVVASPVKSPVDGMELDDEEDSDSDADSDSDYVSFENDETDFEAREHERQLVLEAAGLIVQKDVKPPPRPIRRRSKQEPRRPAPAAPDRSSVLSSSSTKELPPVPEPEPIDVATHLDDAFDRYEAYRGHHQNRLSVASVDTNILPASPTSATPSVMTTSSSGEGRTYSQLLSFLGRKTPVEAERRPTISAPILQVPDAAGGSRASSPAFGSVCFTHRIVDVLILRCDDSPGRVWWMSRPSMGSLLMSDGGRR